MNCLGERDPSLEKPLPEYFNRNPPHRRETLEAISKRMFEENVILRDTEEPVPGGLPEF